MGWDCAEQIVEAVHGAGLVGLGQDPAAAQATQAVDFCEAAGGYEFFAEMEGTGWGVFVNGVEVDLVNQDAGVDAAGDVAYFSEGGFRGQHAAGVVEIGEDDEFGVWSDSFADFGWVGRVAVGLEAGETFYVGLQVSRGGDEEFVGGMLDEDFVAGFD